MQMPLPDYNQKELRAQKIITDSEIAYQIGDKFIAENILTQTRREIYIPTRILENISNKRVLKG